MAALDVAVDEVTVCTKSAHDSWLASMNTKTSKQPQGTSYATSDAEKKQKHC
jgi:hypothetical protein